MSDALAATPPHTRITYAAPQDPLYRQVLIRAIEVCSGRRDLERQYRDLVMRYDSGQEAFFAGALRRLDITLDHDAARLAAVPRDGPLIVIANHPFGIVDGLAACHLVESARGPFKVLVHALLCQEVRLEHYLLPIDFDHSRAAIRTNIASKRTALQVLDRGGTVLIFPAGGVATASGTFGTAVDLGWKHFVAKLVQQSRATVLPMFFQGQNSRLFQCASQFSMTLRLALLMFETRHLRGRRLRVEIGHPVPFTELAHIRRRDLTAHLRQRVESLAGRPLPSAPAHLPGG